MSFGYGYVFWSLVIYILPKRKTIAYARLKTSNRCSLLLPRSLLSSSIKFTRWEGFGWTYSTIPVLLHSRIPAVVVQRISK